MEGDAVAVQDLVTGEWFPAGHGRLYEMGPAAHMSADYEISDLSVPKDSYLGKKLAKLFDNFPRSGYPLKVVCLRDEEAVEFYCLLKSVAYIWSVGDSPFVPDINTDPILHIIAYLHLNVSPMVFSEVLEDSIKTYEKEKKSEGKRKKEKK